MNTDANKDKNAAEDMTLVTQQTEGTEPFLASQQQQGKQADDAAEIDTPARKAPLTRKDMNAKYWITALLSLALAGNHYCCDEPAPLYQQFDDWMKESSSSFETHFNLLFTTYSIPNIFLPLLGGKAVDRYGSWQMLLVFAVCLVIGQFIFALGVQEKNWVIMYIGRVIFGFGGENIYTSKAIIISEWFPDHQIAFAFGVTMSMGRLGTVIANLSAPTMANDVDLPFAIWVGFGITLIIILCSFVVVKLEKLADRRIEAANAAGVLTEALLENEYPPVATTPLSLSDMDDDGRQYQQTGMRLRSESIASEAELHLQKSDTKGSKLSDILKFGPMFWAITVSAFFVYGSVFPFNFIASGILLERDYFKDPPSTCQLRFPDKCTGGTLAPIRGNPSFDEDGESCPGKNFAPVLPSSLNITKDNTEWDDEWEEDEYVFESMDSNDVTCADSFWADACIKNYCDEQDDATEKTGVIMSIPYFMGAVLAAPIGYLSDRIGQRAMMAVISPVLIVVAHFQLAYADSEGPIFPLLLQGIAFAIYCAIIWPCVALTVELKYQGLAYGLITSLMNVGLSAYPLIAAQIYNIDDSYIPNVELFFAFSGVIGLFGGWALNYFDAKVNDCKLNKVFTGQRGHGNNANAEADNDDINAQILEGYDFS
mmetsp:Transcript_24292/g.37442  ORF Transcript_24292/g.37442 Transcript_24292/m.37442 type:complete len:654 (+) Transcript_24292:84-2045(+)|eukprot:CAMPEP_0196814396 /NCGR_PEP_ID=MMETSP1362-20130617/42979_1 /TAXON_ID=163516 /ORGANISM="Leptocylindrus danicus, Strain CCMP1856" /LENGTH=653 /DNA_ID=CAMNT_0042190993 /DNA_START=75 /DNA_END=2036 /DNA_ORIENTATION=-